MISPVKNFSIEEIPYAEPLELFEEHSRLYYSSILTGRGRDDISESSFIGVSPHTIIRYVNGFFEIETEAGKKSSDADFWGYLGEVLDSIAFDRLPYPANRCGAIGYISYEAYHKIEKIESGTLESYSMPLFELVLYNRYFFFDHMSEKAYSIDIEFEEESVISKEKFYGSDDVDVKNLTAECRRDEYIDKVKRIIDYIIEGDVYEVCLTEQFSADFEGNPFMLFKNIYSSNPAPFSAYLNFRDIAVISNSPELFVRCRGRKVETRPIKGTAPRSSDPCQDRKNMEDLISSEKDQAELFMIIDLLRNDIGKVCTTGSVRVAERKRVEAYENVYQLIGIVEGELDHEKNYIDLLKAVFPGGSITGCPKVRSMEIIEELETFKRNIYTGSIFILNREYFLSNIVIRTAVVSGGKIFFNSGGAVTIDSIPENEYLEIMHKVRNIAKAVGLGDLLC